MHACLAVQHVELLQQVCPLEHALVPQQVLPSVAQNGVPLVVQHFLPEPHDVLPQHDWPEATQKGDDPVVQHTGFLPEHAGEQVWAFRDAGAHAAMTPPNNAPPTNFITPRREVGFASSRARLSIS